MYKYYKKLRGYELEWVLKIPHGTNINDNAAIEISEEEYEALFKKLFAEIKDE